MTSKTTFRRLGLGLTAAAAALALAACAPGGAPDPTASAPADDVERVYIEALAQDPNGFNPSFQGGPIPVRLGFMVLGTLVQMTSDYELMPGIAESWDISEDGLTIQLNIREGVTWHDGEPFTTDDVIFNFQEIYPLQAQFGKPLAAAIDSYETPDDSTVILHMNSVYGPFLEALSQLVVTPKHIYEGTDYLTNPANLAPIGVGPMKFESFEPGAQVVLVANDDYWDGRTEVDRAIFPVMTDPAARALALQNGELDSAVVDPSAQAQLASNPDLQIMERGFFQQTVAVTFNDRLPELATPELRAAVFSAIDREAVTELALNGIGSPAQAFFPDSLAWAKSPKVDFSKSFPRDLPAIEKALDSAGYPRGADGTRFSLDVRYIESLSDVAAAAEVVQANLAEVGIAVNLVGSADPVFQDEVYVNHNFGLSLLRNTVSADPSLGITRWLTTNPTGDTKLVNGSTVSDAELDAAAAAARTTLDRADRAEQFHIVQERAEQLIFWAPISWSNGSNNTVNTSRWSNLADGTTQTNNPPWQEMTWIGG